MKPRCMSNRFDWNDTSSPKKTMTQLFRTRPSTGSLQIIDQQARTPQELLLLLLLHSRVVIVIRRNPRSCKTISHRHSLTRRRSRVSWAEETHPVLTLTVHSSNNNRDRIPHIRREDMKMSVLSATVNCIRKHLHPSKLICDSSSVSDTLIFLLILHVNGWLNEWMMGWRQEWTQSIIV